MGGRTRDLARIALAGIRLFNGTAALVAPDELARRLGVDPDQNPGVLYFIRLFGIRTVLIGAELLVRRGERLDEAGKLGTLVPAPAREARDPGPRVRPAGSRDGGGQPAAAARRREDGHDHLGREHGARD